MVDQQLVMGRRALLGAAAGGVGVALVGCGQSDPPPPGVRDVTYWTSFGLLGRDSYVMFAQAEGHFAEVGLRVRVESGIGGEVNRAALASGQAQFAAMDMAGSTVAAGTAATDGQPVQFVAAVLVEQVPEVDPQIAAAELEAMAPWTVSDGDLGAIDTTKVARMVALLESTGAIPLAPQLSPEDLVATDLLLPGGTR